jgi:hypothetical protein
MIHDLVTPVGISRAPSLSSDQDPHGMCSTYQTSPTSPTCGATVTKRSRSVEKFDCGLSNVSATADTLPSAVPSSLTSPRLRGEDDERFRFTERLRCQSWSFSAIPEKPPPSLEQDRDIAHERGDSEEAAKLLRKVLDVNRELRDLDLIATASPGIRTGSTSSRGSQPSQWYSSRSRSNRQLQCPRRHRDSRHITRRSIDVRRAVKKARQVLGETLEAAAKIGYSELSRQINDC